MNPIKQALKNLIQNWQCHFIFGVVVSLIVFICGQFGNVSFLIVTIVLILSQQLVAQATEGKSFRQHQAMKLKIETKSLIGICIVALAFSPTGILLGSAMGIVQDNQTKIQNYLVALWLFWLCCLVFLVVNHGVRLHLSTNQSLARSLDRVVITFLKNLKSYFQASLFLSGLVFLTALVNGWLLFAALPMVFLVCHFQFNELNEKQAFFERTKATNEKKQS